MNKNNKTVLITGASRGIGKAIAIYFAKKGYNVLGTCHSNESLMMELKNTIESFGVSFFYIKCDHADFNTPNIIWDYVSRNNLSIDVLVNNAGISVVGLLQDLTKESWDCLWNTNVTSVISMCRVFIPHMLHNGAGRIINISSVWGNVGASCECAYSATKGAINSFTKALARELAPSNIQVNAVSCGIIDTDMNAHLSESDLEDIKEEIPCGRIGTPEDIAKTVFSLANSSTYLTGQIITVDGAWT